MRKVKIKTKLHINVQHPNYQQDDSDAHFSADALAVVFFHHDLRGQCRSFGLCTY